MEEVICPEGLESDLLPPIQRNLEQIEEVFKLQVSLRGNKIMFSGEGTSIRHFKKYLNHLFALADENGRLDESDIHLSLNLVEEGNLEQIKENLNRKYSIKINGRDVFPKTFNQKEYVRSMLNNEVVFSIGPAGTGKTFLAIAMALNSYINHKVERIVLTRPVVEAGERLGFLPGDIQQKINPYLRPLYDALYYFIGFEKTSEFIDRGIIEIAPLAYMRGRTINDAFIILDEGQNTVNSQMKMFLTRFGQNSRVVITADITQIDLEQPKKSGVLKSIRILKGITGIGIVNLTKKDIVRHPLVQRIIAAYEASEK